MTERSHPLASTRLGVLGKSGSGKSTVLVLLARTLRRWRYDVTVVDADSTNVGLHLALDLDQPPASLLDQDGGMMFSGGMVPCPVDDPTPLREQCTWMSSRRHTTGENKDRMASRDGG
jgi:energy-coupling factor transporter ATP-binding protein EcfA2